ncbi:transmembrane protein 272-like isoform X2 [Trichomycterus rosablanca]
MAAAVDTPRPLNVVPATNIPCLILSKSVLMASTIAHITIGAIYLKECPQQKYIPVYLLVCGVFSVIMALLTCLPCNQDSVRLKFLCSAWNSLVSMFLFCWFITGSVWIYSIYPPNYNSTVAAVPYCNKTLYQFAFWTTTAVYIALAVILVGGCCCCLICLCISKPEEEPTEATQA